MAIGVALITCDREQFFDNCLQSVLDLPTGSYDHLCVVNDCPESDLVIPTGVDTYIHNKQNLGVGKSKNLGLKCLLDAGCDHLFLLEDDVTIQHEKTFEKYIQASDATGIKHLNFCLHGEDNKFKGAPAPKLILDYRDVKLALYHNVYGALSYYHDSVLQDVGLMDEEYFNAMEHVDHTMQIIQSGYHPPFRWFADVADSNQLIHEQDRAHSESKIRDDKEWQKRFIAGVELFHKKFNINVCNPREVYADKTQVIEFLKDIKPNGD
jgi:GT2 family glycosyltransferase